MYGLLQLAGVALVIFRMQQYGAPYIKPTLILQRVQRSRFRRMHAGDLLSDGTSAGFSPAFAVWICSVSLSCGVVAVLWAEGAVSGEVKFCIVAVVSMEILPAVQPDI